jgi:hypothetical protein
MSNGAGEGRTRGARRPRERAALADAMAARRRTELVAGLRGLARPDARSAGNANDDSHGAAGARNGGDPGAGPTALADATAPSVERCDVCGTSLAEDHRHLLQLFERRIECVCESCWALRSGDAEYRPTGTRTVWLSQLELPDEVWASFQIPIGLAFFMESSTAGCVVALYPSPAGATESELHFASWNRMVELNPILANLEADVEGLIVNRLADPPVYAIAPIDRCYELTGIVKASWEGISGGSGVEEAVRGFFAGLQARAVSA